MEYSITHEDLLELVKEEVSRVADFAYTDDNVALYDAIAIFDRDDATVKRMISDASSVVYERFRDYIIAPTTSQSGTEVFNFYLPDMEESQKSVASAELTRFLTFQIVSLWFNERYKSEYDNYLERSTAALGKAEMALFTRKRFTR